MSDTFKGRREDLRLVTGRGRFTADWSLPGELHGCFLRSDRAHAEITALDASQALSSPGVRAVLTGDDLVRAGIKNPRPLAHFKGKDGTALKVPHRHALAHGRVRFVGEPVALVVADSETAAQDAAERIVVSYRDLPAVIDAADALAAGAPQLHADVPGNLAVDYEYGNRAATEAAFASAHRVVRVTVEAQRIAGNPMEPKSCLAACDPATGICDLYLPTQGAADVRKEFAYITDGELERLRVHSQDVGGAFGVRNEIYPEFTAVLMAAQAHRPPGQMDRDARGDDPRRPSCARDRADRRGRARRGGHFPGDAGRMAGQPRRLLLERRALHQHRRVADLDGGQHLQDAGVLWAQPARFHQHHPDHRVPWRRPAQRLLSGRAPGRRGGARHRHRPHQAQAAQPAAEESLPLQDADRIHLRQRRSARPVAAGIGRGGLARLRAPPPRGQGGAASCAASAARPSSSRRAAAARRRSRSGSTPRARCSSTPWPGRPAKGTKRCFPILVAEILGMAPDDVTLRYNDPEAPALAGMGSFGSRSLISHGSALSAGAHEVRRKGMELAAKELEVAAGDLVFERGRYRVPGTDLSIGVQELARKHAGDASHPLDTVAKINTAGAFPSGAHIAEVEIDPDTGTIELISAMWRSTIAGTSSTTPWSKGSCTAASCRASARSSASTASMTATPASS